MCMLKEQADALAAMNSRPDILSFNAGMEPQDVVYDVPDGEEEDAEVLRSEMLFFNTPRTEEWSSTVYETINNVQEQCYGDYMTLCEPEQPFFIINSPSRMIGSQPTSFFGDSFLSDFLMNAPSPMIGSRPTSLFSDNSMESMFNLHSDIRNFFESDFQMAPPQMFTLDDVPMSMSPMSMSMGQQPSFFEVKRSSPMVGGGMMDLRDIDLMSLNGMNSMDIEVDFPSTDFAFASVLDALFESNSGPRFSVVVDEMARRLKASNEGWKMQHGRRMINAIRSIYRSDLSRKVESAEKIEDREDRAKALHKDLKMKTLRSIANLEEKDKESKSTKARKSTKDMIIKVPADPKAPQRSRALKAQGGVGFTPVVPRYNVPMDPALHKASRKSKKSLKDTKGQIIQLPSDPKAPQRKLELPGFDLDADPVRKKAKAHTIASMGADLDKKMHLQGELPHNWTPIVPPNVVPTPPERET